MRLTVAWERAENAGFLSADSGVVFPEARLTVGWRPMINSGVLDWEAEDLDLEGGGEGD